MVPECKAPYVKAGLSTQKCKDVRCEIQTHVRKEWEHRQTFERNVTTVDEDALLDTIYGIIFEKSAGAGRAGLAMWRFPGSVKRPICKQFNNVAIIDADSLVEMIRTGS